MAAILTHSHCPVYVLTCGYGLSIYAFIFLSSDNTKRADHKHPSKEKLQWFPPPTDTQPIKNPMPLFSTDIVYAASNAPGLCNLITHIVNSTFRTNFL